MGKWDNRMMDLLRVVSVDLNGSPRAVSDDAALLVDRDEKYMLLAAPTKENDNG